ncbi:MAG: DnaB-like helicase N-terminal domain-containing protein, partial [Patescibacteria group bacterium]
MTSQDKLPPQNIEAEKSLLGCLMIDPVSIYKVVDFLLLKDFYKAQHSKIYDTILELFEKREPVDILSVSAKLKVKNELDEVGGASYLTELVNAVPTASHIANYAKIVQEKRILRELISAGYEISEIAQQETEDVDSLLDRAEKKIFSIAQKNLSQSFSHIKDSMEETWQRIDELSKNQGGLRGIPTGFKSLDNMLSGFQKSDLIILAARPSIGKCVSGDTEIVLSNPGGVQTIEEVVKCKKGNILSLNESLKIDLSLANDFINNGIQPVYKVKTASGREVETTATHPFLTINGWIPLSEIKAGEKVAVPRIIPIFGKQSLPAWQIKSLAYYIAEGGLTGACPTFTSGNELIAEDFMEAVKMFPDIKIRVDQRRPSKNCLTFVVSAEKRDYCQQKKQLGEKLKKLVAKNKITQKQLAQKTGLCFGTIFALLNGHTLPLQNNFIEIISCLNFDEKTYNTTLKEYEKILNQNSVTNWLQSLGLMGKLAIEKFIPAIVFQLKKEEVALFLNRLFACDGSFPKSKDGRYRLSYSSGSYKLIKQVQHLLLRFGVLNRVREKKVKINGKVIIAYELESLDAPSLLKFIEEIGVYGKEKKLAEAKKYLQKTKLGWTQDTIPIEIWNKITRLKGARSWASLYKEMGFPVAYNIHAFRRSPRRETVLKLAKVLHSQELENLARSDIYWDKIVNIKYNGEKQVYDLTVPSNHNFIANDFIVHNSSLAINIAQNVACFSKIP